MFGVALAPPAGAAASVSNERLAGANRYGTAAAIAGDEAFAAPTTAIVATGENFPDALAASSLAGANAQAPIILTQTGTYSAEAKTALAALKVKGVTALTIVGGTVAVSQTVEDAIKADGFTVSRVAGDDRYETAAAIATAANTKSPSAAIGGLKTGLFATGLNFPDALAGGPAAYANKLPLLLVNDGVPAETANAISTLGIKKAVILGGTAAVSAAVEAQLVAATGNPVTRLAGTNRYSTAAAIGDYESGTLGFPVTAVVLATGLNFPDALAAGPLGGQLKAPVVLTASLPAESAAFLDKYSSTIQKLYVSGGTSAIDDATVAAAELEAEKVGNDSAGKAVTTRPELTGAVVVSTTTSNQVTPGNPAGTKVRYTFDEAIGTGFAPNAARFKVWNSNSTLADTADSATLETGTGTTGTTVLVNFPNLASAASAASLSKATVVFEAVRDAAGAGNPEGEAPIGTAGTTPSAAGSTAAPDLVSVGSFRQGSQVGSTAIDFTFDAAAQSQSTTAFHIVDVNGNDPVCVAPANGATTTGGGSVAGGNGTTVITVTCTNVGGTLGSVAGSAYSAGNVARGYVVSGGVGTTVAGASPNPLQAADVAGSSLGPDLTAAAVSTTAALTVVFQFDQTIANATAGSFFIYNAAGGLIDATGGNTATVSTSDARQVAVTFDSVTGAIGGYITGDGTNAGSAVRATDGATNGNRPDEEGFAGSSSTLTPGKVTGPDLTGVALVAATDAFGATSGYNAVYTFDVAAGVTITGVVQTSYHLYVADGSRYNSTTCAAGTGATGSTATGTVRCTAYTNHLTGSAPAAITTLQGAVLGTVEAGAASDGTNTNTEGAAATTGGNGTPAS